MEAMLVMIPVSIILVLIFLGFFIWAANKEQFDDLDTDSKRMLFDDIEINKTLTKEEKKNVTND
jgi:cbb3-type cytochrome oxidase maturation protein